MKDCDHEELIYLADYGGERIWHCLDCGRVKAFDLYSGKTRWSTPAIVGELERRNEEIAELRKLLGWKKRGEG